MWRRVLVVANFTQYTDGVHSPSGPTRVLPELSKVVVRSMASSAALSVFATWEYCQDSGLHPLRHAT